MGDELDESHVAWQAGSADKLDAAKDRKHALKKALADAEKKQADKVAAAAEARRLAEVAAAAAAARAKRLQEEAARARFKAAQAADLQAKKDAVKAGNKAEGDALKMATLRFAEANKQEHITNVKNKRITDIARIESILRNAYIKLNKQNRMWFVWVQMCEMRLEAREKRPPSELFADSVQSAIERELTTINEARASLKALVDEGEKLNSDMIETRMLIVTAPSRENVVRRRGHQTEQMNKSCSLRMMPGTEVDENGEPPSSPQQDFHRSMDGMFVNKQPTKEDLLQRAKDQVIRANELTTECYQVLENCRNNCNKVMALSNSALDTRIAQVSEVRDRLEKEKLSVAGSIRDASHRLVMLKMKAQHQPQTEEDQAEIDAVGTILQELKEAKLVVDDDWRAKSSACKIDEFCRKLTPIRAATQCKNEPGSPSGTSELETTNFPDFNA